MIIYKNIILLSCSIFQIIKNYGINGLTYNTNNGFPISTKKALNFPTGGLRDFVVNVTVTEADYDTVYVGEVSKNHDRVYQFKVPTSRFVAIRIMMSSFSVQMYPVLFVFREPYWIQSWQIPLVLQGIPFTNVSRTLCPAHEMFISKNINNEAITADVSTSSPVPLSFQIKAQILKDFLLQTSKDKTFEVTPSQPQYFMYELPATIDQVLIRVTSPDKICMVVSIQDIQCPVFDLVRNVQYTGTYQKMTYKSGITFERDLTKKNGNKFYVVFVVEPNDYYCMGIATLRNASYFAEKVKTVTVRIEESISKEVYLEAVFGAIGFFLSFFLIAGFMMVLHCRRNPDFTPLEKEGKSPHTPSQTSIIGAPTKDYGTNAAAINTQNSINCSQETTSETSSIDEKDIDFLDDADSEKDVLRTKTFLYVSDLARKNRKRLSKKYKLYYWNLITLVVLYALPVIQLVITYQKILHESGDQDICYYNFFCARPFRMFSSFNNVFSNIGYILLGVLFLGIVWRRDLLHKKALDMHDELEKNYGIPNHFGLYYAMGIALVMEGILSACYHICPNYSNFQFDTSFMYMIAGLCMLKIYQIRHPDINANSSSAYLAFAATLFVGVIGVMNGGTIFWIIFTLIHILSTFALSVQIYYMGRWKLNLGIFKRIYLNLKNDYCQHFTQPMYMDRMILLLIGNAVNWSVALYGVITQPKDFATHLLEIFIINLLLYVAFYIIMKIRSNERILFQGVLYIFLSSVTWATALYFFLNNSSSWEQTPAMSKEKNADCILLNFYDSHDVWHFLSACSMFFSFMILLTLDDDLVYIKRDKIPVF